MILPIKLINAVIRNSIRPMAISEDSLKSSASPNWLAIMDAIELPVDVIESGMLLVLPISMVTVIVSPSARPIARIYEEKMPEPATGNITLLITSARVAPRLYALSFKSLGTIFINSALRDAAYGIIIIANTNEAVRMPEPCGEILSAMMSGRNV